MEVGRQLAFRRHRRHHVLERLLDNRQRALLGLVLDHAERAVDEAFGDRFLIAYKYRPDASTPIHRPKDLSTSTMPPVARPSSTPSLPRVLIR